MARGRANERLTVVSLQKIRYYFGEKKVKVVFSNYHIINHTMFLDKGQIWLKIYLKEMIEKK